MSDTSLVLNVKNIVLVGDFRSSIPNIDKYFFIKNDILNEDEILPISRFDSIGGSQISTTDITILIAQNQIIVSTNLPEDNKNISEILHRIIKYAKLSEVTALGINFHWLLTDSYENIQKISKKYFYNSESKIFSQNFDDEQSMFGAYASKNFLASRLKMDIKPSTKLEVPNEKISDVLNFSFNFHFDIKPESSLQSINNILGDYLLYFEEGEQIIKTESFSI